MTKYFRFDKVITGFFSGLILPFVIGLIIFSFSSNGLTISEYLARLNSSNIITHSISICVFPNVLIFLLFNWLDMLKAAKGVLAITIIWAIIVFAVKFLG